MKLFNFFKKQPKQEKYLILQWGSERSIIQEISSIDNPVLIVDNQYLMNMDERGLVL